MEGTVAKRRKWMASFKPKYFVLFETGSLLQFASSEEKSSNFKPRYSSSLSAHDTNVFVKDCGECYGMFLIELTVRVRGQDTVHEFAVESAALKLKWMKALQSISRRKEPKLKYLL
eukprot:CAMPEP_0113701518 /NCGR_PEP_ID=MMETSP0038_2-20120614/24626_1 /TAXON_ID=2898 /ORGANISM="Cryptomonas paramecium" /LENGTH=115 /DNA_ID=CAMNT_0000625433 /DNA_START=66 /DNA_END=413 /DNA_ORIENTATION=- /assembly_acc=CAM_ASM_000170